MQETIQKACDDYVDMINKETIEKRGLKSWKDFAVKKDYLVPPGDITAITSEELGKHLWAITEYEAYLFTVLSNAEIEYEKAKSEYYTRYAEESSKELDNKTKGNATEREIRINSSSDVTPYFQFKQACKCKILKLKRNLDSVNTLKAAYSREISRREAEMRSISRVESLN